MTMPSPVVPSPVALAPIVLPANQPRPRAYRGGAGIARFRGVPDVGPYAPEDFVASTTEVFGGGGVGLTTLPDGRLLRDAIAQDPAGYLGEEHTLRFGADPALLVKLLHTGQRLFVHFHPSGDFAKQRLHLPRGKTEAWIIVETEGGAPGEVHLGFRRDVTADEVARWVADQDVAAMLDAMHRLEVSPGDTLFVPSTLAHSIGTGITLVELQEPVDVSILMEYRGFGGLTDDDAFLGLDAATALAGLDRSGWSPERVAALIGRGAGAAATATGVFPLFDAAAAPFFRADRLEIDGDLVLEAGFSILVVTDGTATLSWTLPAGPSSGLPSSGLPSSEPTSLGLVRGQTVLIPAGVGALRFEGRATVLRCRPPRAA
jgi:mannose-6-phosphate isomerase